jgi:adenine-specific DNA-methyltransferase
MNKINKTSPDILKERLSQLKRLMPDLFTDEGQLNEDELRFLTSQFSQQKTERYEFRWAGKAQSKKTAFIPSKATLVPDKKRSIAFDDTENCIIEGDNLEVLKLLQKSYFNKIKCIYIDPPYNTGNDFIYNDNFSENKKAYWEKGSMTKDGLKLDTNTESVGRYHSNWLDMMQSRLLLARNLLRDDGVIFVSIDDHEIANLRKLMDEVFGEEGFVVQIVWQKKYTRSNDAKYFSENHEYILVYSKSKENLKINLDERSQEQLDAYSNPDNDKKGVWKSTPLHAKSGNQTHFIFTFNNGVSWSPPQGTYPRFSRETLKKFDENNEIWFGQNGKSIPSRKTFLKDVKQGVTPVTIWNYSEAGHNHEANTQLKELIGEGFFDNPKPTRLIAKLINLITANQKNDIILDFFAGSGTTAQAVMELNKSDGGNRKYILVQLPEKTNEKSEAFKAGFHTISDICIERVKRAGEKINKENDTFDAGFKVFSLRYSNFPENLFSPDPDKSEEENIQAFDAYLAKVNQLVLFDFESENLLYEIALKEGFSLHFQQEVLAGFENNTIIRITDESHESLVCLDEVLFERTVVLLKEYREQRFICLTRAIDTTKKWNLEQIFANNLWVV